MVDTYFSVKNDNNIVVIDDTYQNLSFVHFSDIVTVNASDERTGSVPWYNQSDGSNGRYESFSRVYTFKELDLVRFAPSFIGIRRVDSNEGGFAMVNIVTIYDPAIPSERVAFQYRIRSMEVGAQYQMVCFAYLANRVPSTEGLTIYNSNQQLIFDAALGYMQVMDSQYHLRDLYSSDMQSFPVHNSGLPNIDYSRMFLISTQRPFATTGGTIIVNYRQYVPRLRKSGTGIFVDLGMWGNTGGNRLQQYQRVFSFLVAYIHF